MDAGRGVALIRARVEAYQAPQRAGCPKGQPVGLSRQKYYVALLAGCPYSLRTRARLGNVSYGLLRKWRTEPAFRQAEAEGRVLVSRGDW